MPEDRSGRLKRAAGGARQLRMDVKNDMVLWAPKSSIELVEKEIGVRNAELTAVLRTKRRSL